MSDRYRYKLVTLRKTLLSGDLHERTFLLRNDGYRIASLCIEVSPDNEPEEWETVVDWKHSLATDADDLSELIWNGIANEAPQS